MDIKSLIENNQDIMTILQIIADLELRDCWLAAGLLRNMVWNHLSGREDFDEETDVDVVFYDPQVTYEETLAIEQNLRAAYPHYKWEVKNEVYMNIHTPGADRYASACDAIARFPERCTAIGARLHDGDVELFLPYGAEDIVNFEVRPTPSFAGNEERMAVYRARMAKKNWADKWPKLVVFQESGTEIGKTKSSIPLSHLRTVE
ncbi:nucleotidyltransferase family protein [Streptococcus sp. HF-1907]|uniref:nucleotidyltransferase family protein n=1 Tax=Streptococcus sp. HF-1907 TaxID=2785793 RepID=UPI00189D8FA3|nr:nucleotidyltransferase family protein [Streptococcus sp. HF-1907]MBF7095010.1 nucleotidyltransferase family protein [Streptococcus sp. HF-1907]